MWYDEHRSRFSTRSQRQNGGLVCVAGTTGWPATYAPDDRNGTPAHALCRHRNAISIWWYSLLNFTVSGVPVVPLVCSSINSPGLNSSERCDGVISRFSSIGHSLSFSGERPL